MKKKEFLKLLLLFAIFFMISFCYGVFFLPLNGDEIWNYGFSYNIAKGLVIYRDFNVMVTPLYFFFSSIFIHLFGNYLISIHLFDCILIGFLAIILYKRLGLYKLLLLYPLIIIYYFPSYNYFSMFLLFVIIYLLDSHDNEYYDVVSFLAGLIFISKQSIGMFLLIPVLFYSKNRLKSLVIYLIPFFVVSFYLFIQGAFFEFINYCFLGMFDFGKSNLEFSIFFWLEGFLCLYLIIQMVKGKFKDKKYLFILMFQVNAYPIFDMNHFVVCLVPVIYCVVKEFNFMRLRFYYRFLLLGCVWSIFVIYVLKLIFSLDYRISLESDKFWYLRNNSGNDISLKKELEIVEKYYSKYEYSFIIGSGSYAIKLYSSIPIGQYDLLADGNLGYYGEERVIREIDSLCGSHSCGFFVEKQEFKKYSQFSKKIYDYVLSHYKKMWGNEFIFIYDNQNT